LQLAYHGWLRLALAVRAGQAPVSGSAPWLGYVAGPGEPDPAGLTAVELEAIRRPPGGRLNRWVFARLSEQFGSDPGALEAELFGGGPGPSPGP
jgi:hypothetical protein